MCIYVNVDAMAWLSLMTMMYCFKDRGSAVRDMTSRDITAAAAAVHGYW
jgi:hypothetical protein